MRLGFRTSMHVDPLSSFASQRLHVLCFCACTILLAPDSSLTSDGVFPLLVTCFLLFKVSSQCIKYVRQQFDAALEILSLKMLPLTTLYPK